LTKHISIKISKFQNLTNLVTDKAADLQVTQVVIRLTNQLTK